MQRSQYCKYSHPSKITVLFFLTNFTFIFFVWNSYRAKDIVKISLIPSHNAANVNNGSLNNATQIDEQIFNKLNITNKETKPVNKYVNC